MRSLLQRSRRASALWLAAGLVLLSTLLAAPAQADVAPDEGLAMRQQTALEHVAAGLTPLRPYDTGEREDCVVIQGDGFGLVAQLELDRRGLAGGADPATAAPWALHMAQVIPQLVGTGGVEERCHWNQAGAPGIMNATLGLAYALHRYGQGWPADVKEAIRAAVEDSSWVESYYLHNANINIVVAELLAGEALASSSLLDRGLGHLEAVVERTMQHGGIELNAPLYTAHHLPPLVFAQALSHDRARSLARVLLEYTLLIQGHLYLPGGGLGAPQSRDYSGGAGDGGDRAMLPVIELLIGDAELSVETANPYDFIVAAATDYVVPESIRAVFLDKANGYEFWAYTDAQQGASRTPDSVYDLGLDGERAIPWQAVVLPGGTASLGVAYGYRLSALYVASGTYLRAPSGAFSILYQYQPSVTGDTDHTGSPVGGSGHNDDPDDFTCELYDYERLVFGRTAISLWDPTTQDKPPGVMRVHQDTRVHLPNYGALGGETLTVGEWRLGRLGEGFVAFRPLGTVSVEESRDGGAWTYLRIDGRSGGITELSTASEFASLDEYAADLAARQVTFTVDPLTVEFEARDPSGGSPVTVRLEHRPERRVIGGVEQTIAEALDHGLMESPWTRWDPVERTLRLQRECYPIIEYDWDDGVITESPAAAGCDEPGDAGAGGSSGTDAGAGGGAGATPPSEDAGCGCAMPGASGRMPASGAVVVAVLFAACRRWRLGRMKRSTPLHRA